MKTRIDGKVVGAHSKLRESCSRHKVEFKTKRGKTVSFIARPGGTSTYGGECGPRKATAGQRAWRREFGKQYGRIAGKASRECKNRTGGARKTCLRAVIKNLAR